MAKSKLKIYLDTNIYGRLFDDLSAPIVYTEAIACLSIFKFIADEKIILITSDILDLEINQTELVKRNRIKLLLPLAKFYVKLDNQIIKLAHFLESKIQISGSDALHLASAIKGKADYFITQDKRMLKKSNKVEQILKQQNINLIITNSLSFIQENI